MEIWKDIPGYEGFYQVSDMGRVRSVDRKVVRKNGRPHTVIGKILRPSVASRYSIVQLRNSLHQKGRTVHSLVMLAFVGERVDGIVIDHLNGDTYDNRLENLEYVTQRENVRRFWGNDTPGVHFDKSRGLWAGRLSVGTKSHFLGRFKTKRKAHDAVKEKEVELGLR